MCIIGWDLILYENSNFFNFQKLHVVFIFTKTGTQRYNLDANTWYGYYCLMTVFSLDWKVIEETNFTKSD